MKLIFITTTCYLVYLMRPRGKRPEPWIPFEDRSLNLERCREDLHMLRAKTTPARDSFGGLTWRARELCTKREAKGITLSTLSRDRYAVLSRTRHIGSDWIRTDCIVLYHHIIAKHISIIHRTIMM